MLADSKVVNLKKMREAGIKADLLLLRSPALSEIDSVIKYADISLNTELFVIEKLSEEALKCLVHKIIVMVEMGDLREGIMPGTLETFIENVVKLEGIKLVGIGVNFACFGGVKPNNEKMIELSLLATKIESKFAFPLSFVSGGEFGQLQLVYECYRSY